MHISYQPLWNTLKERGMRKEDLRLAAGLTTNKTSTFETFYDLRVCLQVSSILPITEYKKCRFWSF